jgi:phenylalanyl-tRNA synthetase alpha chain
MEKVYNLKNEALALINQVDNLVDLQELKISFLGRKGKLNQLFSEIAHLPKEEKIKSGKILNEVKQLIQQ